MATITIKGVSDETLEKIKARAKRHHRSLNKEIIHILQEVQNNQSPSLEELLQNINRAHRVVKGKLGEPLINEAKGAGRE